MKLKLIQHHIIIHILTTMLPQIVVMMMIVVTMAIMIAYILLSRSARVQGNDDNGSCDNGKSEIRNRIIM